MSGLGFRFRVGMDMRGLGLRLGLVEKRDEVRGYLLVNSSRREIPAEDER